MERGVSRCFASVERSEREEGTPSRQLPRMFTRTGMVLVHDPQSAQLLQLRFRLSGEHHEEKVLSRVLLVVLRRGVGVMHRLIRTAHEERGGAVAERIAARLPNRFSL